MMPPSLPLSFTCHAPACLCYHACHCLTYGTSSSSLSDASPSSWCGAFLLPPTTCSHLPTHLFHSPPTCSIHHPHVLPTTHMLCSPPTHPHVPPTTHTFHPPPTRSTHHVFCPPPSQAPAPAPYHTSRPPSTHVSTLHLSQLPIAHPGPHHTSALLSTLAGPQWCVSTHPMPMPHAVPTYSLPTLPATPTIISSLACMQLACSPIPHALPVQYSPIPHTLPAMPTIASLRKCELLHMSRLDFRVVEVEID